MDVIIDKGCGLDVHKETVVACVMGSGIKKEIRTFSTMTEALFRLKGWLSYFRVVSMSNDGHNAIDQGGRRYGRHYR